MKAKLVKKETVPYTDTRKLDQKTIPIPEKLVFKFFNLLFNYLNTQFNHFSTTLIGHKTLPRASPHHPHTARASTMNKSRSFTDL